MGLWFAIMIIVPTAQTIMEDHHSSISAYFDAGFMLQDAVYHAFNPLIVLGGLFFLCGILFRRKTRILAACHAGLMSLGVFGLGMSAYLFACAGVGMRQATIDGMRMRQIYEQTLADFVLLEAAQDRYAQVKDQIEKSKKLILVEIKSVEEFSGPEILSNISRLIAMAETCPNPAVRRRVLATLALFRGKIRRGTNEARNIPKIASELGAPQTKDAVDALEWVSQNFNKGGWEPLPLLSLQMVP